MEKLMEFTKASKLKELVPLAEMNSIISFCHLFDVLAVEKNGVDPGDNENFPRTIEMWFIFCVVWSICAPFDEDSRKKIDNYMREVEGAFPNKDSIYEYIVEPKLRTWQHWEERLRGGWRFTPGTPYYKIVVPTVDTIRYNYLVTKLVNAHYPVMLTSSNDVQSIIESRVEKRTKGVYVPLGGRKMVTFMDDFNMPAKDTFGSQPPLELIRLWLDYGFWTCSFIDMFLLVAMGPPGGGRMVISRRLQSRFNLINMTFPNNLQDFEEELKPIGDVMTEATIDMYNAITARFLPTPTKIHYLFNLRDISRIFQGLMRIRKTYHDTRVTITRLWIHECFRVFSDRLNDTKDNEAFVTILSEKLAQYFDQTYHNICHNRQPPIFEEYNNTPGVIQMDLVLFRDAIEHVSKVVRVIRQPLGNMLLVGIGGSGRQSLTRIAAHLCEYTTFQIEVVEESFLEDINNVLSSGEVPGLYKPDEFEEVRNGLADQAKKDGIEETNQAMFAYLIERVRMNLHVVLCMSPVGEAFRNRIRMFPAFVNNMTIDWFSEWPHDALLEVAEKYLSTMTMASEEENKMKPNVASIFAMMHRSVSEMSAQILLYEKRKELGDAATKLKNGLFKIDETRIKV
ncbi:hypothetical protein NP493_233g02002 [Ridgeia piscesae]|uniref:Dynein heavy chain n=1 Tax=Ridgeia piscesae TaxID=27915 RepID=A0AAD9NZQ9_RIDPI|nr:hypothetical protein NP493_233g02002 [Ridgeia piscesae]